MVTAVVLIDTERDKVNSVAEALADLITNRMLRIDGITDSETLLALRAYSRHDLESMFSVGMEG